MVEHNQLHEHPGFLWHFPLRGALARPNADDSTADADALAWFQRDVADQPITLVEQAQHRDTRFHRRHSGIYIIRPGGGWSRFGNGAIGFGRWGLALCRTITCRQPSEEQRQ